MAIHTDCNERCSTAFLDLYLLIMCTWCWLWTAKLPHYAIPFNICQWFLIRCLLCWDQSYIQHGDEVNWLSFGVVQGPSCVRGARWWSCEDDDVWNFVLHLTLASVVKGECYLQGGFFETHTHVFELVITASFQSSLFKMLLYTKRAGWWRREGDVWNRVLNLTLAGVLKGEQGYLLGGFFEACTRVWARNYGWLSIETIKSAAVYVCGSPEKLRFNLGEYQCET